MNCPKNKKIEMNEIQIGDIVIDKCPDCKGIWLDYGELEALIKGALVSKIESEETKPNSEADKIAGKCPRCHLVLWRRKIEEKNFHVEICPSCFGVWLDEGELRLIDVDNLLPVIVKLINEPI